MHTYPHIITNMQTPKHTVRQMDKQRNRHTADVMTKLSSSENCSPTSVT